MRRYLLIAGVGLAILLAVYLASWFAFAPSISPDTAGNSLISPYSREVSFHVSRPLSRNVRQAITLSPTTGFEVSFGASWAGPNTRLTIRFKEPLRSEGSYSLIVPQRGWGRDGGDYQFRFRTEALTLEDKQEGSHEDELAQNPILEKLPYDGTRFRVEWNSTDEQNRYIFDVTVFASPGETPEQALAKYRPEAERWIKSTGQPPDTYVTRYQVQQLVGE